MFQPVLWACRIAVRNQHQRFQPAPQIQGLGFTLVWVLVRASRILVWVWVVLVREISCDLLCGGLHAAGTMFAGIDAAHLMLRLSSNSTGYSPRAEC